MRVSVIYSDLDEVMDIDPAMNLMKTLTADSFKDLYNATIPLVTGKDIEIRKQVYRFGLRNCIKGESELE